VGQVRRPIQKMGEDESERKERAMKPMMVSGGRKQPAAGAKNSMSVGVAGAWSGEVEATSVGVVLQGRSVGQISRARWAAAESGRVFFGAGNGIGDMFESITELLEFGRLTRA
jgi:hypothetical protein